MAETAVYRQITASHIRPFDAPRDLLAVADLLEEAFQGELDSAGVRAVREMRLMGRWGGLLARLDNLAAPGTGIGPGFVWIEDGQLVGHLSLRRATPFGKEWLVGNVAVRATYRGQGIARTLMTEAIGHVRQQGGSQISLLVRADNVPAVHLYTHLGFHQTGTLAYWQRPIQERRAQSLIPKPNLCLPDHVIVRRSHPGDQRALYDLARIGQPEDMAWVEPVRYGDFYVGWDKQLGNWVNGQRQVCLVAESSQGIAGAAWGTVPRQPDEGRLRVRAALGYQGQLETALVSAALDALEIPTASLVCDFPAHEMPMYLALAQFGFVPLRILAHMQLRVEY